MSERYVVALAGNPNAGKTTIFNALTGSRQHVGNWPGKTVEKKEGVLRHGGVEFEMVDLPGTYSLNAFSPEEVIARDFVLLERPDLVVNVVDAGNLERNLYLTVQLLELGAPLLIVLNQMDMARSAGVVIDQEKLSALLGQTPVIETVGNREQGVAALMDMQVSLVEDRAVNRLPVAATTPGRVDISRPPEVTVTSESDCHLSTQRECQQNVAAAPLRNAPAFRIHYGEEIQTEMDRLATRIAGEPALTTQYRPRWLALKLLEGDADLTARVARLAGGSDVLEDVLAAAARIEDVYGDTADIALADARYGFIHGVTHQVVRRVPTDRYDMTARVDRIVTNRVLGLPIFLVVMYLMFKLVVDVSAPFLDWTDGVITGPVTRWAESLLTLLAAPEWLHALVTDGIIAGVGGVLVFLPGLFVLYLFLTFLEDSGYMARVAFLMDKLMSFTGLQGKSFIPLILGFGCAVPAIYATRTLENERDRIATGLLVPLMSCSARLPVYVVFGMAFFPRHAGLLITGLYLGGIVLAAGMGWLFSRTLFRAGSQAMFALELPPYRLPTFKGLMLHTWEKSKEFVYKAGTVILSVSVVLWVLMNLPWGVATPRESYFGRTSEVLAPIFAPAGFATWEASGALVTGFIAKEVVVSTMSQLYLGEAADEVDAAEGTPTFGEDLGEIVGGFVLATVNAGKSLVSLIPGVNLTDTGGDQGDLALSSALGVTFTPLAALAFLVFVLVYTPCVATLGAIRGEYGWKWLWVSAGYQFTLAWFLAVVVYQGGRFLGWG